MLKRGYGPSHNISSYLYLLLSLSTNLYTFEAVPTQSHAADFSLLSRQHCFQFLCHDMVA